MPGVATVRRLGGNEVDEAVFWLHDIVEDTDTTLGDLRERDVPREVISGVDLLTHWPSQSHREYLLRLAGDPQASGLKIVDSTVNFNATLRLRNHMSPEDFSTCLRKYAGNISFLAERLPPVGLERTWSEFAMNQARRAKFILNKQLGQSAVLLAQTKQRPAFAS